MDKKVYLVEKVISKGFDYVVYEGCGGGESEERSILAYNSKESAFKKSQDLLKSVAGEINHYLFEDRIAKYLNEDAINSMVSIVDESNFSVIIYYKYDWPEEVRDLVGYPHCINTDDGYEEEFFVKEGPDYGVSYYAISISIKECLLEE